MKKLVMTVLVAGAIAVWLISGGATLLHSAMPAGGSAAKGAEPGKAEAQQRNVTEELMGLEKRRQQLMEKEAALAAKEQELNRISSGLDARLKALNAAQKTFEDALNEKKKREAELANAKYMKMFKLLKAMRPEEAARIMDKLEEPIAIGLLEKYDQKTVLKLAKFISQQRLLKWIKENLQAGAKR